MDGSGAGPRAFAVAGFRIWRRSDCLFGIRACFAVGRRNYLAAEDLMYSSAVEIIAVLACALCFYHSWQAEGSSYAQQWFAGGYYFALLSQVLLVQFGVISYSDQFVKFGSAPAVESLLIPAVLYVSYITAQRLIPSGEPRLMVLLMFLLTAALMLPIDATALEFDWWSFPSGSVSFLNGIPYFAPVAWGLMGALFYGLIRFVRRIRFRGNGQLFALILGTPLVAGINLLLFAAAQIVIGILGLAPENILLDSLMALVLILLPLSFIVWRPGFQS
jgi:hypothetical protein